MRRERDTGAPALTSIVDEETTTTFQGAVRELEISGAAGLARYETAMMAARGRLTSPGAMLDEAQNLADLRRMVDVWWQHGLWWAREPYFALPTWTGIGTSPQKIARPFSYFPPNEAPAQPLPISSASPDSTMTRVFFMACS
jgi:hypothetical protein